MTSLFRRPKDPTVFTALNRGALNAVLPTPSHSKFRRNRVLTTFTLIQSLILDSLQVLIEVAGAAAELAVATVRLRPINEVFRASTLGSFVGLVEGQLLRS